MGIRYVSFVVMTETYIFHLMFPKRKYSWNLSELGLVTPAGRMFQYMSKWRLSKCAKQCKGGITSRTLKEIRNMEQETLYNILSGAYGEVLETHAMWQCITSLGIKPFKDGNQWCYLYGDNIQDGIAGFGETIFKAAWDFYSHIKTEEIVKCKHSGSSEIPNCLNELVDYARRQVEELLSVIKKYDDYSEEQIEELRTHLMAMFLEGAGWQKKQMLKEAVKTMVTTNLANRPVIYLDQLKGFQYGDKVHIIIVKEDEK